ncbi:hypothetical protein LX36DRAFT_667448 [Colletotrichum falcatum]|nr:hypothetical protein LX36DRAFT_667448 [Colletotrichum falcatum]
MAAARSSVQEAKAKGCVFDVTAYGWVAVSVLQREPLFGKDLEKPAPKEVLTSAESVILYARYPVSIRGTLLLHLAQSHPQRRASAPPYPRFFRVRRARPLRCVGMDCSERISIGTWRIIGRAAPRLYDHSRDIPGHGNTRDSDEPRPSPTDLIHNPKASSTKTAQAPNPLSQMADPAAPNPASLDQLPAEVLLQILRLLPDLPALFAAIETCARLRDVYRAHAGPILSSVLRSVFRDAPPNPVPFAHVPPPKPGPALGRETVPVYAAYLGLLRPLPYEMILGIGPYEGYLWQFFWAIPRRVLAPADVAFIFKTLLRRAKSGPRNRPHVIHALAPFGRPFLDVREHRLMLLGQGWRRSLLMQTKYGKEEVVGTTGSLA